MAEPADGAPTPGVRASLWRSLWKLPNLISLSRVPLAAAYLLVDTRPARVAILIAAAASDYLDGWAARRFHADTVLGEVLDPITDKVFVLTALVAYYVWGEVAAWQLGLLLLRDLYIVLAFAVAAVLRLPIRFRARMSGKVVTVLQLTAVLQLAALPDLAAWSVAVVAAASVWAVVDYTIAGLHSLRRARDAG